MAAAIRSHMWILYLTAVPLALLLTASCESESPCSAGGNSDCPALRDFSSGFYGTVTAASEPYLMQLEADNRPERDASSLVIVTAETDSAGRYRLALPPGMYELRCRSEDGDTRRVGPDGQLGFGQDPVTVPDSLPRRLDLAFPNELRVTLNVPDEWENRRLTVHTCRLWRDWLGNEAVVHDGIAVFRVLEMPAGSYRLRLTGYGGPGLLLPPRLPVRADTVHLQSVGRAEYEFTVPRPGRLSVEMTGSVREMGASSYGWLFDAESTLVLSSVSDSPGSLAFLLFAHLANARLWIGISPNGRWYGGEDFHSAMPLDLEPGRDVALEHFECGIEGTFEPYGTGHQWTLIEACDVHGTPHGHDRTRGPDGSFYIADLDPGVYYLRIMGTTLWPQHWFEAARILSRATPIAVDETRPLAHVTIDSVPPLHVGAAQ